MGIKTEAKIDIEAPAEEVFSWLTEYEKLKAWSGVEPNTMPKDTSELKVGYKHEGTMQAPDGPRPIKLEVTAYDPPTTFEFTDSYAGGGSTCAYKLTANGSGTTLEMHGETDMAAPAQTSAQMEQTEEQIKHLPFVARMFAKHQMKKAKEMMKNFGPDAYAEQLQPAMQQQTEQQLQKLKGLIEVVEKEKKEG